MATSEDWCKRIRLIYLTGDKGKAKISPVLILSGNIERVALKSSYDKPYMDVYNSDAFAEFSNMNDDIKSIFDNMEIKGAECPRCGKATLIRTLIQTRSADEGASMIAECIDGACKFKKFDA